MTNCPVCKLPIDSTIQEIDRHTYKFKCENPNCIVDTMILWEKNLIV